MARLSMTEKMDRMDNSVLNKSVIRILPYHSDQEVAEGLAGLQTQAHAMSIRTGINYNKSHRIMKVVHEVMRECVLRYGGIAIRGLGVLHVGSGCTRLKKGGYKIRNTLTEKRVQLYGSFRASDTFKKAMGDALKPGRAIPYKFFPQSAGTRHAKLSIRRRKGQGQPRIPKDRPRKQTGAASRRKRVGRGKSERARIPRLRERRLARDRQRLSEGS